MIPQKIFPHFEKVSQKKDSSNLYVQGNLVCCNAHNFEIFTFGTVRNGMFSRVNLLPKDERIMLKIRCKKCGKVISVFDSSCDGYETHDDKIRPNSTLEILKCKKCLHTDFSVNVRYEYPDLKELMNLGLSDVDNKFTWIYISLMCNECGRKYKNFINLETD